MAIIPPYSTIDRDRLRPVIERASGPWLYDTDGQKWLDASSSWWVNIFGHNNPEFLRCWEKYWQESDSLIFADFSHVQAETLIKMLDTPERIPGYSAAFSDNGSTAVEIALKFALDIQRARGYSHRRRFISLTGGYHGDTWGAMSVGSRSAFTERYQDSLFPIYELPFPDTANRENIRNCLKKINPEEYAGFIYEPLVQGSSGFRVMDPSALNMIMEWMRTNKIILIADEVATGFYRTGTFLASAQLNLMPDIITLGKILTGGLAPLGLTMISDTAVNILNSSSSPYFLYHGHSYTAYPVACAAACATLELFSYPHIIQRLNEVIGLQKRFAGRLRLIKRQEKNIRVDQIGMILAVEYPVTDAGYHSMLRDTIRNFFQRKSISMRPLGNTLYYLPVLDTQDHDIKMVHDTILEFTEYFLCEKLG